MTIRSRSARLIKQETQDRETFFAMTDDLRERFSQLNASEVNTLVREAVADVRVEPPAAQK